MAKKATRKVDPSVGRDVLKRGKTADWAPNHPFAHDCIIIIGGQRMPHEEPLPPGGSHGVEVSVSWGYELHTVKVSARKWKRIRAGESLVLKSIGWYEGTSFPCRWHFDLNQEHSLVVCYGAGGEGFVGNIGDATVEPMEKVQR